MFKVGEKVFIKGEVVEVMDAVPYPTKVKIGKGEDAYLFSNDEICLADKIVKTYSKGLADAWELAQRVMKKRDWNDIDGYFKHLGIRTYCELFEKYSYEEALAKLEAYEKAKEREKTNIKEVAKMLGVELYEEFRIQPTEYAIVLGHKENDYIFRFDTELVHKGHNDGYSEWYGGCEKILNYLILGLYVIVKGE